MKKFNLLLTLFSIGLIATAQPFTNLPHQEANYQLNKSYLRSHTLRNDRATCTTDTVYYTDAKATQNKIKLLFSDGTYASGYGQFFRTNQSISVIGFRWYGYSFDATGTTNPVINVDCSIYAAGADSLPSGAPLATETVQVDTTTANAEHNVIFSPSVSVGGNYVIVVSHSQTDQLFVLSNDENAADGGGDNLSCSFWEPGGGWVKNQTLWAFGDYDMLFLPIVQYNIAAGFTNPTNSQGCVGQPTDFNNTSSAFIKMVYYNSQKFAGNPISYHWDYGDSQTDAYLEDGSNVYAAAGNYTVTLVDTMWGWTMFCVDSKVRNVDIFDTPPAPASTPPVSVCEGSPMNDLTATGTGGTFTWYQNPALSIQIGTGSPFNPGYTAGDTVYVTETVNGCEGAGTMVDIIFDANPAPNFDITYLTGTDYSFTNAPAATNYSWDFDDGSPIDNSPSPTHTFPGTANYNVCLTVTYANGCVNTNCQTVTFLSINEEDLWAMVDVYPNPTSESFYVSTELNTKGATLQISDLLGKVHQSHILKNSNRHQVDASDLSTGIYFVTLVLENGHKTTKKIVVR
jgi:PKD repeat protein